MSTMLQIGFIFVGVTLMLALLGLGAVVIMPSLDRWSKRFFTVYFLTLSLYAGFGLAEMIGYAHPEMSSWQLIFMYFDSLFPSVLMPQMTLYLLHCCKENWRQSALFHVVAVLWSIFFIMLNMNLFTNWFYYISPEDPLHRGPLYPLMMGPLFAITVLNLIGAFRQRNRLSKRYYLAFLTELLPMAVAMFIHFFVPVFELLTIAIVIGALSMLGIILSDQNGQYLRQQRDIAHQRASIMVLQMRPHFIYNTMMSIYYLCKQNPDLAQQVTLDFTTYLRKNFTAIASEDLIPFSEELEHTRAYLAVEQAQFDDMLVVDYDITVTGFRLPPLTLQPIVENAVKHGMDQDSEPLHVFIKTDRTGTDSVISVENTGADFDPRDDSEPHIALNNIRQRLEMMCGGSMTIKPRAGSGTVVTVTIPESGH